MTTTTTYRTEDGTSVPCEWFARCTNETVYAADTPVGVRAICTRCADVVGLSLQASA